MTKTVLPGLLACACCAMLLALFSPLTYAQILVAVLALLCALWWVTEPIPVPATSLLPLALLPLFGVLTPSQVAQAYGHPLILLLMAGCMLSKAMERSDTHLHLAVQMLHLFGSGSARRVVWGFMAASAVLSMWVSNTATTLMLLPVALAVIRSSENPSMALPLLLGIGYAASIGGMGTPIGTPPNLILMSVYEQTFGRSISFAQWMAWGLPVVIVLLPLAAWWLTRNVGEAGAFSLPEKQSWTIEQRRVLWVFLATALAWISRTEPWGGWQAWLGLPGANDASVAMVAVIVMFAIPNGRGGRLLDWDSAVRIPWSMLLLFSGGIALAKGFVESGLADQLAELIASLSVLPTLVMIVCVCLFVTFMTEVTSNTASTSLLMPVLAAAAVAAQVEPLLLMLPAALSASCAFMLPVATAPNAIIYGSAMVPIKDMVRFGIALNLLGVLVIAVVSYVALA